MRAVFKDPDRERKFQRDGFVIVPLLSSAEVRSLLEQTALIQHNVAGEGHVPGMDHSFCTSDAEYRLRLHDIVSAVLGGPVVSLFHDYRLTGSGLLTKLPGGATCRLHRDRSVVADLDTVAIDIWCPLVDIESDAYGNLAMLPGSHKLPNAEVFGVKPFYADYAEALEKLCVSFPLKAGEAVLFDHRLLHWAHSNSLDVPRPVARAMAMPVSARMVCYRADPASGGRRFEIVDAEADGLCTHSPRDLATGEVAAPTLAFVDNDNREVSYRDCLAAVRAASGAAPLALRQIKSEMSELLARVRA
jgi:phytanoyl-CoA dioxygenase PhyH